MYRIILLITLGFSILLGQGYNTPYRVSAAWAPFYHGVASGDPTANSVIIWTRVTPDQPSQISISGDWEVATDTNFTNIVASGTFSTDTSMDYTVHVDVTGLQPNTWYYYRFKVGNIYSMKGRTKTLPDANSNISRFRMGVVSCSNYQHGYFNAYAALCQRNDIDLVVHLGDYIYEYAEGIDFSTNIIRKHEPNNETITLEDYRIRYSQYRLDPYLRWIHQNYPFIVVWDDHELANDAWKAGAQNHDPATEGDFFVRKANMLKANREWMPIRIVDPQDSLKEWRKFQIGTLADLIMIDTRHYDRDKQPSGPNDNATINDTNRYLIGQAQMQWLQNNLKNSTATWKIIGNQVMFAPVRANIPLIIDGPINVDQWDGYEAERQRLVNYILSNNIDNFAFITGDIHSSWANDLPFDPNTNYDPNSGAGSIGVEFVTTSVTSQGLPFNLPQNLSLSAVQLANKHVKYVEGTKRGFLIIDVTPQKIQGDWFHMEDVTDSLNLNYTPATFWYVNNGEKFLRQANNPITVSNYNPPLMYEYLPSSIKNLQPQNFSFLSVYPNPVNKDVIYIQYYIKKPTKMQFTIYDATGKQIYTTIKNKTTKGSFYHVFDLGDLAPGMYNIQMKDLSTNESATYKFIKQ